MDQLEVRDILYLDKELNSRKEKVDEIALRIIELGERNNAQISRRLQHEATRLETAMENYLNAMDILCLLFRNSYIPKIWENEYKKYVHNIVKTSPTAKRYNNIIYMDKKWYKRIP